jgi:hypothetical protein
MSLSDQQGENRDIERQHNSAPRTSTTTATQHEYLPASESYTNDEEAISPDAEEGDATDIDIVAKEGAGPRKLGRKVRPKHARRYDDFEDDASDSSEQGNPHSPIVQLPTEVLSRILAHLDPATLLECSGVCKAFARVVKDEATWRLAFGLAFRIENIGELTTPILRRVDAVSWKAEYTRRTELLR